MLVLTARRHRLAVLSLNSESKQLDVDIANSQQEATRLHAIILQVQEFEQRKAQLQQRVVLIEQLRKSQTGPVHMLDQISRSLPPMLWLTALKQDDDGHHDRRPMHDADRRCPISSRNLEAHRLLQEVGGDRQQPDRGQLTTPGLGEVVKFSVKGVFITPGDAAAKAAVKPARCEELKHVKLGR